MHQTAGCASFHSRPKYLKISLDWSQEEQRLQVFIVLSLPLSFSLPAVFYRVTAEKREGLPSAAGRPSSENMWPGSNWVTTAAVQWAGLDLENDSIYFCLTVCFSHSCSFYPALTFRLLLFRSGRSPGESGTESCIKTNPHIQQEWWQNGIGHYLKSV